MKIKIYLSDGSSQIVDLGEVPEDIRNDQREMFELMKNTFIWAGIDLQEVLIEELYILNN